MSDTLKGALWMIGAIIAFPVMAVSGREVSGQLDTFELMMFRSIIGLLLMCVIISATRRWNEITTDRFGTHTLRNIAHFTGQNLWFYAVPLIPLAQVFALEFTTPIWVILLAPLLVGERLTPVKALCAVLGFLGILIVARPGTTEIGVGVLTAAGSAIFFAFTTLLTKRLTQTASVASILFWLTAIQLVLGVIAAGYDGDIALPTPRDVPFVIAVALCGLIAHFCITKALCLAPATIVSPIDFARLPVIAVAAFVLYSEPLDIMVFLGAMLIFCGNYLNIWTATRRKPS